MKRIIQTDGAPAAIGAYTQAVQAGDTVYVSGQIPLDPNSMAVVEGGFEAQARQVFKNLAAVAEAAGSSLQQAVKLTCYLTDLGDFPILNQVMAEFIQDTYPSRAAVEVAGLPKGSLIEIDAVLHLLS